jgi:hypothetical protein
VRARLTRIILVYIQWCELVINNINMSRRNTWCTQNTCGVDWCTSSEVLDVAASMKESGMLGLGYDHINLDDCWGVRDNVTNQIKGDPVRFPQGMKVSVNLLYNTSFLCHLPCVTCLVSLAWLHLPCVTCLVSLALCHCPGVTSRVHRDHGLVFARDFGYIAATYARRMCIHYGSNLYSTDCDATAKHACF